MPGIADVAREAGVDVIAAKEVLDAIKKFVAKGEKVQIKGFGTFRLAARKARSARNPKTGETVAVPAKTVLVFKASK